MCIYLTPHPFTHSCKSQAPFLFFLRTPVGDILATFAKDQNTLDESLPDTLHMTGIYLIVMITALIIVIVSIHYYAAVAVGLGCAFFLMLVRLCVCVYRF